MSFRNSFQIGYTYDTDKAREVIKAMGQDPDSVMPAGRCMAQWMVKTFGGDDFELCWMLAEGLKKIKEIGAEMTIFMSMDDGNEVYVVDSREEYVPGGMVYETPRAFLIPGAQKLEIRMEAKDPFKLVPGHWEDGFQMVHLTKGKDAETYVWHDIDEAIEALEEY